ncbi:MAG: hypothetical protein RR703_00460 [Bacilli bacterium]
MSCEKHCETENVRPCNNHSSYLTIIVLYILLAIIVGSVIRY